MRVSEVLIENFFKTNFKKSALISYIVYPFLGKIKTHHSNNRECYTIAEILNELEYNIDIINWDNTTFLPIKSYDLVVDNHNNLERLSDFFIENTKKVIASERVELIPLFVEILFRICKSALSPPPVKTQWRPSESRGARPRASRIPSSAARLRSTRMPSACTH